MNFPASALVVLLLMTTLSAIALSEEIPLTCPDTARRELQDISEIFNCIPSFIPQEEVAICRGVVVKRRVQATFVNLTFKMLEEAPEGTAICIGLLNVSLKIKRDLRKSSFEWFIYSFDFNPFLAVGILTTDHSTSKTDRSCSISLLSDVLNLRILSQFEPWDSSFWNFSSSLLGTQSKWIQSLSLHAVMKKFDLMWLEKLQNTNIQSLYVTNMAVWKPAFVTGMPVLRKMIFDYVLVDDFHKDSFLGMPEMEVLILKKTVLCGIPQTIDRMPKLKILGVIEADPLRNFTIPTKELSTLTNLEVLNLRTNQIYSISGKLPPLPKLRILNLDDCYLSVIEESDFMGYPMLEELTISKNMLNHIEANAFLSLKKLKILDLTNNYLKDWPVLYDFSLLFLNVSQNFLTYLYNFGNTGTTIEVLNISFNRIPEWEDKYIFSLKSPMQPHLWVKKIDISVNLISGLSETMMQSLVGIQEIDLGGNEFSCVDCRMIPFQKWLNTTSIIVNNFGTSDPLPCWSPGRLRGTPVNLVQFDEEPCLEKIRTTSLLTLIGVPVGVMSILAVAAAGGIYKYRSEITYMLRLYKIRQRAKAFSRSVFNKYAFDAFICYRLVARKYQQQLKICVQTVQSTQPDISTFHTKKSCRSQDRRFVLTRLAPLLEKGEEQYCLCLHERDFPLGSHIVSNIVGSIQHSRKTIVVLSEYFISSKWCNWEFEMANHKMFNEDEHFLILIQLENLERSKLPRHLQFLMDTRTYLEWPSSGQNDEVQLVVERLKKALGPSIFQKTQERPPLLEDVMEDY